MGYLIALVLSFSFGLLYAFTVYWLDRYEKEPLPLLVGVFGWGAVVAVIGALISQIVLGGVTAAVIGAGAADLMGSVVYAPLTEESLKGFAVLLVFLVFRREFDSILDGIVYAGIAALGFAATENVLYLGGAWEENGPGGLFGLFVLRVLFGAWDHPFYTAFMGIGLALARLSTAGWVKVLAPVAGWMMGMAFHGLHNFLATASALHGGLGLLMFLVDWMGWAGMAGLILWSIRHEGQLLATHLSEEVEAGVLTAAQYRTAISTWSQSSVRFRSLGSGRWGATRRFYHLCGELAHKKNQHATLGEGGAEVEALRGEIQALSPAVG